MVSDTPSCTLTAQRPSSTSKATVYHPSNPGMTPFHQRHPTSTRHHAPSKSAYGALLARSSSSHCNTHGHSASEKCSRQLTTEPSPFNGTRRRASKQTASTSPCGGTAPLSKKAPEPTHAAHVPYTGNIEHEHCNVTQRDLIFHSFALTSTGYLLPGLREACSLHPLIWWRMRIFMPTQHALHPQHLKKTPQSQLPPSQLPRQALQLHRPFTSQAAHHNDPTVSHTTKSLANANTQR